MNYAKSHSMPCHLYYKNYTNCEKLARAWRGVLQTEINPDMLILDKRQLVEKQKGFTMCYLRLISEKKKILKKFLIAMYFGLGLSLFSYVQILNATPSACAHITSENNASARDLYATTSVGIDTINSYFVNRLRDIKIAVEHKNQRSGECVSMLQLKNGRKLHATFDVLRMRNAFPEKLATQKIKSMLNNLRIEEDFNGLSQIFANVDGELAKINKDAPALRDNIAYIYDQYYTFVRYIKELSNNPKYYTVTLDISPQEKLTYYAQDGRIFSRLGKEEKLAEDEHMMPWSSRDGSLLVDDTYNKRRYLHFSHFRAAAGCLVDIANVDDKAFSRIGFLNNHIDEVDKMVKELGRCRTCTNMLTFGYEKALKKLNELAKAFLNQCDLLFRPRQQDHVSECVLSDQHGPILERNLSDVQPAACQKDTDATNPVIAEQTSMCSQLNEQCGRASAVITSSASSKYPRSSLPGTSCTLKRAVSSPQILSAASPTQSPTPSLRRSLSDSALLKPVGKRGTGSVSSSQIRRSHTLPASQSKAAHVAQEQKPGASSRSSSPFQGQATSLAQTNSLASASVPVSAQPAVDQKVVDDESNARQQIDNEFYTGLNELKLQELLDRENLERSKLISQDAGKFDLMTRIAKMQALELNERANHKDVEQTQRCKLLRSKTEDAKKKLDELRRKETAAQVEREAQLKRADINGQEQDSRSNIMAYEERSANGLKQMSDCLLLLKSTAPSTVPFVVQDEVFARGVNSFTEGNEWWQIANHKHWGQQSIKRQQDGQMGVIEGLQNTERVLRNHLAMFWWLELVSMKHDEVRLRSTITRRHYSALQSLREQCELLPDDESYFRKELQRGELYARGSLLKNNPALTVKRR